MKKITKKGFQIAASGTATQIVLFCHGGWVAHDGVTTIPSTLRVCFYAGHGHYTVGGSVYSSVMSAGILARGGLLKRITMSDDDLSAFAGMIGKSVAETRELKLSEAVGVYDSFGGGNAMFNYALSREPAGSRRDAEVKTFKTHLAGGLCSDIDLMMMNTSSGRHLSDVFNIIKDMGYETLHFGACRVPYGASPSEVSH